MIEFTLWDIARNLLFAARWTVALSIAAFIGGSLVGLGIMMLRISKNNWARRFAGRVHRSVSRHAIAVTIVRHLFWVTHAGSAYRTLDDGGVGFNTVCQRFPWRNLARWRRRHSDRTMGCWRQSRAGPDCATPFYNPAAKPSKLYAHPRLGFWFS